MPLRPLRADSLLKYVIRRGRLTAIALRTTIAPKKAKLEPANRQAGNGHYQGNDKDNLKRASVCHRDSPHMALSEPGRAVAMTPWSQSASGAAVTTVVAAPSAQLRFTLVENHG